MAENFAENVRNVEFSNNVTMTLRETPGMLYPMCGSTQSYTGNKAARIENRFARLKMQERTERNGDTRNSDIDNTVRFIVPGKLADVAPLLDPDDAEVTSVDLGSALVNEVAQATVTYHDDMFIRGFYGNGWSGEAGNVAVPFKSANILAHGGLGITLNKLLALKELMRTRHVNVSRDKPIILLPPPDVTALEKIEEYKNSLYNDSKPLVDGEIKPWLGFRFFTVVPDAESLPSSYANFYQDAGLTRNLPVIVPSGMHRGVWREFKGSIDDRADKGHSTQFWGAARSAVARTDEDKAFIVQTQ